jgi:hypothetical protein
MNETQENSFDAGSVPVTQAPPVGSKNLIRDFFGIIFDPVKTFHNVLAAKYWIGILLVILLISVVLEQIYHPVIIETTIARMTEKAGENAQALQGIIGFYNNPAISRPAFALVTAIAQVGFIFIWTVLCFFVGSVVFGGTSKFKGVWIISCWSWIIALLQGIINTPLILATRTPEAGLNLGLIFSENLIGVKLHKMMAVIDLFSIWYFIVLGIGLSILYKFSTKKGIGIAFIVWSFLIIIRMVFTLLS